MNIHIYEFGIFESRTNSSKVQVGFCSNESRETKVSKTTHAASLFLFQKVKVKEFKLSRFLNFFPRTPEIHFFRSRNFFHFFVFRPKLVGRSSTHFLRRSVTLQIFLWLTLEIEMRNFTLFLCWDTLRWNRKHNSSQASQKKVFNKPNKKKSVGENVSGLQKVRTVKEPNFERKLNHQGLIINFLGCWLFKVPHVFGELLTEFKPFLVFLPLRYFLQTVTRLGTAPVRIWNLACLDK